MTKSDFETWCSQHHDRLQGMGYDRPEFEEIQKAMKLTWPQGAAIIEKMRADLGVDVSEFYVSRYEECLKAKAKKTAHGEQLNVDDESWNECRAELFKLPYTFLPTKKDGRGYWIEEKDKIQSWHVLDGELRYELLVRNGLREAGRHSSGPQTEMLKQLAEEKHCKIDEYVTLNRDLIHFENGFYNIKDKTFTSRWQPLPAELAALRRKTLKVLHVDHDPDFPLELSKPTWADWLAGWNDKIAIVEFEHMLHRALVNPDFPGQREIFWEYLGYCFSSRVDLRKALINVGVPKTAKTTVWEKIVLPIFSAVNTEESFVFSQPATGFRTICEGTAKEMEVQLLLRLIFYDDDVDGNIPIKKYAGFKTRINLDRLPIRELYMNSYEADSCVHLIGNVNLLPVVYNADESFYDRIILLFWLDPYLPDEWDPGLVAMMQQSKGLKQYICRKAIFAMHRLFDRGHFEGMDWRVVEHHWRLRSDSVFAFVDQCCERVKTVQLSDIKSVVYYYYKQFVNASPTFRGLDDDDTAKGSQKSRQMLSDRLKTLEQPIIAVNGGKRTWTNPEDGEENTKRVDVYLGLKVDLDKLGKFVDLSFASEIKDNVKKGQEEKAIEKESLIEHDIMSALSTTLGGNLSFQKAMIVMNAWNANHNGHYTMDEWLPTIANLVAKGKVLTVDDEIMLAQKKTKAEPTPKHVEYPIIVPEPDPMALLLKEPPPVVPGKDLSDAALDDDVDKSLIMALQDTDTAITPDKVHDRIPTITVARAKLLLRQMELERMMQCIDPPNEVYKFT